MDLDISAANTVSNINVIGCDDIRSVHIITPRGGYCPIVVHECLSLFEHYAFIYYDGLILYQVRDVRSGKNKGSLYRVNGVFFLDIHSLVI